MCTCKANKAWDGIPRNSVGGPIRETESVQSGGEEAEGVTGPAGGAWSLSTERSAAGQTSPAFSTFSSASAPTWRTDLSDRQPAARHGARREPAPQGGRICPAVSAPEFPVGLAQKFSDLRHPRKPFHAQILLLPVGEEKMSLLFPLSSLGWSNDHRDVSDKDRRKGPRFITRVPLGAPPEPGAWGNGAAGLPCHAELRREGSGLGLAGNGANSHGSGKAKA